MKSIKKFEAFEGEEEGNVRGGSVLFEEILK